jgi:hypothetical protein
MASRIRLALGAVGLALFGTGIPQWSFAFGEIDPSFRSDTVSRRGCGDAMAVNSGGSAFVSVAGGVARFRSDGSLDAKWGDRGVSDVPVAGFGRPAVLLPLPNGQLLVIGKQNIARMTRDGELDQSYGNHGLSDPLRDDDGSYVESAALQDNGSVVTVTRSQFGAPDTVFTRIDAQGKRDRSFGDVDTRGMYLFRFGNVYTEIYGWGVQADGSIEIAAFQFASDGTILPKLIRYPGDPPAAGSLVPRQGIANWFSPNAKVQPNGSLVIASRQWILDGTSVSRFDASGKVDASFGDGGRSLVSPFSWHRWIQQSPRSLWLGPDGEITLVTYAEYRFAGWAGYLEAGQHVFRLKADGTLDLNFENGKPILEWDGVPQDSYGVVAQLDDGRLLLSISEVTYVAGEGYPSSCHLQKLLTDTPRSEATVVEYFHPKLNHYFLTLEGFESDLLDSNVESMGWVRTGQTFGVWMPTSLPGASRVCRFYGDLVAGPNSHFYTTEGSECDALRDQESAIPLGKRAWRLEKIAFSVAPALLGQCPANLTPVYRAYNRGFEQGIDPNHRYTTDPTIYATMQSQGWVGEGARFCVPPVTRNDHLPS